jgi:tRNA threonylcarbamoyladenosine biosynthesis protein TsaE
MLNKDAFVEQAKKIAQSLVPQEHATILALSGDLGAGKTTFVQTLSRELGVTEVVTSPTFVIMKKYQLSDSLFDALIHIDAYRLKNSHELEVLGWNEMIKDPTNLICIEWPERVESLMPPYTQHLTFTFIDEEHRDIKIAKSAA